MKLKYAALVFLFASCTRTTPPKPAAPLSCDAVPDATHRVEISGAFGSHAKMIKPASETPEWMEVPPGVTAELNDSRREVVCSVLARRGVRAGTAEPLPVIAVKLGSPDDGLLMRVEQSSTKNERRIPPATGAPELRTNFEHTFDSLMSDFD